MKTLVLAIYAQRPLSRIGCKRPGPALVDRREHDIAPIFVLRLLCWDSGEESLRGLRVACSVAVSQTHRRD